MTLVLRNEEKIENQLEINSSYGKGIMYVTTNAIVLEQKNKGIFNSSQYIRIDAM